MRNRVPGPVCRVAQRTYPKASNPFPTRPDRLRCPVPAPRGPRSVRLTASVGDQLTPGPEARTTACVGHTARLVAIPAPHAAVTLMAHRKFVFQQMDAATVSGLFDNFGRLPVDPRPGLARRRLLVRSRHIDQESSAYQNFRLRIVNLPLAFGLQSTPLAGRRNRHRHGRHARHDRGGDHECT
jgi:hypothetical protein